MPFVTERQITSAHRTASVCFMQRLHRIINGAKEMRGISIHHHSVLAPGEQARSCASRLLKDRWRDDSMWRAVRAQIQCLPNPA